MRRVYYSRGRAGIQARAMDQFRATRDKINGDHPDLLASMGEKLGAFEEESSGTILIDRKKTLLTVMKLLELKSPSPEFSRELQKIIQRSDIVF